MRLATYCAALGIAVLHLATSVPAAASDPSVEALKALYKRPELIPFPDNAPYSPQMATLGKMLFFDPSLSGHQNLSCASCHNRFRFQWHDFISLRSVPVAIRMRDSAALTEIDSPGAYVQQVELASYNSLASSSRRLGDRVILPGGQRVIVELLQLGAPVQRVRKRFQKLQLAR